MTSLLAMTVPRRASAQAAPTGRCALDPRAQTRSHRGKSGCSEEVGSLA